MQMTRNRLTLIALLGAVFMPQVHAQPSAFTYQGALTDQGASANGLYDLQFSIYDAASNGTSVAGAITNAATEVSNGLFVVSLDFGPGVFVGDARWIELAARTNGAVSFVTLSPRQFIASVPYAVHALSAAAGHSLDAVDGSPVDAVYVDADGQVGIGWPNALTTPQFALQVQHGVGTGTVPANQTAIFGNSASGYGVVGFSKAGDRAGVWGSNSATSGDSRGVWGRTTYASGAGVYAEAWFSGVNRALHAKTHSPDGYAGYFEGGKNYFEGDVGIGTNSPATALHVVGTVTATAFNPPSDRNLKENFEPVSARDVLDKVTAIPISRWNFKGDATPHVGPMAQDFYAAFGVGTDNRHIATVDADGVALAAIQGLNEKVERKDAEITELRLRMERLERMLQATLDGDTK